MKIFMIEDKQYKMFDDGYLMDPSTWDEEFSKTLCLMEGVVYEKAEPWVKLSRSFFTSFKLVPTEKPFKNFSHRSGMDYNEMLNLFGNLERLCRLSGLHKPWMCGCK